jgi:hypothetical protein
MEKKGFETDLGLRNEVQLFMCITGIPLLEFSDDVWVSK